MVVAKKFRTDKEMHDWLAGEKNLENLKEKYPPSKYKAELNLDEKRIEIFDR